MAERILLVEDETKLAMIIKETLELYAFEVFPATDGAEGLRLFTELKPDLVILDIMMPKMDGLQVLDHIRRYDTVLPVIILTAKTQTPDLVKAFELGCNDYIKKPFIMDELLVRIRALLSRKKLPDSQSRQDGIYRIGGFIFNLYGQELRSNTQVHALSFKETEILDRLCRNPNRVLERKRLLLELWGDDNLFNSRNLNVYITKLRNYFKEDNTIQILNIRGIGYKLITKNTSLDYAS